MAGGYGSSTVKVLRELLQAKGLPSAGRKAELIARLEHSDRERVASENTPTSTYSGDNVGASASQNGSQAQQNIPQYTSSQQYASSQVQSTPQHAAQLAYYGLPPTPQYTPQGVYTPYKSLSSQGYTIPPTPSYSSGITPQQDSVPVTISQPNASQSPSFLHQVGSSLSESMSQMPPASLPSSQQNTQPSLVMTSVSRPLGTLSVNQGSRVPTVDDLVSKMKEKPKAKPQSRKPGHVPVPEGQYLGYYEFEKLYALHDERSFTSATDFRKARRSWLADLGIDVMPYSYVWAEQFKKEQLEQRWALETPDKRREVEKKAILIKHHVALDEDDIPLRAAPLHLIGPLPISYAQLENDFFNIPERRFYDLKDFTGQRNQWLTYLGLFDSIYNTVDNSDAATAAIETIYELLPILDRRAIEAKARYLKMICNPPAVSWMAIETANELYPSTGFSKHAEYNDKRREWLKLLEMDHKPFWYKNVTFTEAHRQAFEVAWSEKPEAQRIAIQRKAEALKAGWNPLLDSWILMEDTYGYSKEKDKEFRNDYSGYLSKRRFWLNAIGLGALPYSDFRSSTIELDADWKSKSLDEKKAIVEKAKAEKERYVRDKARQQAAIASGQYQAPKAAAPLKESKTMTGSVSKPVKAPKAAKPPKRPRHWSSYTGHRGPSGGYVENGWLHAANGARIRKAYRNY